MAGTTNLHRPGGPGEGEEAPVVSLEGLELGEGRWGFRIRHPDRGLRATAVGAAEGGAVVAGTLLDVTARGWMARLSETGELLWAVDLGLEGRQGGAEPRDLVATGSGEVLVVGSIDTDLDLEGLWVARVTLSGEVLEQRVLVPLREPWSFGGSWASAVAAAPGGGFFVTGGFGTADDHSLLSLRLDAALELVEIHVFHTIDDPDDGGPSVGSQGGLDVVPLPGGGRAVVGSHEDRDWGPPPVRRASGWLLLLDEAGEPGPGCMASFPTDLPAYDLVEGWATPAPLELEVTALEAPTSEPALPVVADPDPEAISEPYECPPPHCEGLM